MSDPFAWVAPGAFGLSILSLGFQGIGKFRGRARIRVAVEAEHDVVMEWNETEERDEPFNWAEFKVIVENPGSAPLSIRDVGLYHAINGDKERSATVVSVRATKNSWSWTAEQGSWQNHDKWDGPDLPAEVPARGFLEWTIKNTVTRPFGDDWAWQGYAERFRAGAAPKRVLSKERPSRLEP